MSTSSEAADTAATDGVVPMPTRDGAAPVDTIPMLKRLIRFEPSLVTRFRQRRVARRPDHVVIGGPVKSLNDGGQSHV